MHSADIRETFEGWSRRTVEEVEYWPTNSEGYFGCDDAARGLNSSASNLAMVQS
jgi:hypothetical protein